MNSEIFSKNMRLNWRRMTYPQLSDPRCMEIISHGTRRSAGVRRVYSGLSIQGHAEVPFSFVRSEYPLTPPKGAIMFNDSLSIEQCERLMTQLAETAFPFQCAHGRSVPPLGNRSSPTDVNFEYNFCPL